jgi:hypothetical protein
MTSSSSSTSGKYCFEASDFEASKFDAATFVTAAKEVSSLEVLRDHLRGYQRDLREELYQVINRDLADYLNLSSRLSGVEAEVLEIRAPLEEMATHVHETRDFAASKRQALLAQLQQRADLQSRKAILEKRVGFLHTLADAEMLLGMPGAGSGSGVQKKKTPLHDVGETVDPAELTNHCGVLERLAQAWITLMADLYCFPDTEEEDDMPTASGMGLRLLRVEKALLQHLAAVLRTVICPKNLVISLGSAVEQKQRGKKGQSQEEPSQVNIDALRHCLRAFVVLGRGDEAEKQTARLLMLPFIDLNFTQGRLDGGSRGSCSGLATIYAACMDHIQRNLGQILLVGEECASSYSSSSSSASQSGPPGLDLICNSVWRPIHQALCSRLSSIFAPGIASILHANYVTSMAFLHDLTTLIGPSNQAALHARLQAHSVTKDFYSKWNLPVYFHLRFSEVSSSIDHALAQAAGGPPLVPAEERGNNGSRTASPTTTVTAASRTTPPPSEAFVAAFPKKKKEDALSAQFHHPIFATVWHTLLGLWEPDVFLPPLTSRLFKLTLQIVGRFTLWLEEAFAHMEQQQTTGAAATGARKELREFVHADAPDVLVNVSWDAWLFGQEAAREQLEKQILQAVQRQGPSTVTGKAGGASAAAAEATAEMQLVVREGLAEALQPFEGLVRRGWQAIHVHVVAQCVTVLEAVRGITATYRMTNKRAPERASPYVSKILDPLRALEPGVTGKVPPCAQQPPGWKVEVLEAVLTHYLEATRELLNSVEQMEDALKKRKQRTGKPPGTMPERTGGAAVAALSDSDKIKLQLFLDVVAFAEEMRQAAALDDPITRCEGYTQLLQAVGPARHFLRRDEVKATLPAAVQAFFASSAPL